jgi:hypothetical protein
MYTEVTTSQTVSKKWKIFNFSLERNTEYLKMLGQKMRDAHRKMDKSKYFRLRDNESQWLIMTETIIIIVCTVE